MGAESVADNDFETKVLGAKGAVLVDFWAPWCGPCRQLAPVLDEIAGSGSVKVLKMDIDQNPETPRKFGVRGIPTLMIFKDGQLVSTKVGALPKAKLQEWIDSAA